MRRREQLVLVLGSCLFVTYLVTNRGQDGLSEQPPEITRSLSKSQHPVTSVAARTVLDAGDKTCGYGLVRQFGVHLGVEQRGNAVRVIVHDGNTTDLFVYGRAVGPALTGVLSTFDAEHRAYTVEFPVSNWDAGDYEADVVVSWIADRFLGQRWQLPSRNDNPPFDQMKSKCISLTLEGKCERFGVRVWNGKLTAPHAERKVVCDWFAAGRWLPAVVPDSLLDDPVGLNRFRGVVQEWKPYSCSSPIQRQVDAVLASLRSQGIARIALFGDSMLVEQFHMLHAFFGSSAAISSGKFGGLRSMEFHTPDIWVKFFRSYTTSGGHSVIGKPRTVVDQLATFTPDAVVGNLAVLHWQQNMRGEAEWRKNLQEFNERFTGRFPALVKAHRAVYFGPTLIHMGRTQGLQPKRTAAFAAAARAELAAFHFFDPMNVSIARRESSFDGQHWACYHRYGGVSHTISQLLLRYLAP
jgi:hypothetical protein